MDNQLLLLRLLPIERLLLVWSVELHGTIVLTVAIFIFQSGGSLLLFNHWVLILDYRFRFRMLLIATVLWPVWQLTIIFSFLVRFCLIISHSHPYDLDLACCRRFFCRCRLLIILIYLYDNELQFDILLTFWRFLVLFLFKELLLRLLLGFILNYE